MIWNLPGFRYDEIREAVADVIEDYGIIQYPFSLFKFIRNLGIRLVPFSMLSQDARNFLLAESIDGYTKRPCSFNPLCTSIFYDETLSYERIRFTLAHELGHIFLEHGDTGEKIFEDEANFFANYLLGPNPIVMRDSSNNAEQIMSDFYVSYTCACAIRDRTVNRSHCGPMLLDYERRI